MDMNTRHIGVFVLAFLSATAVQARLAVSPMVISCGSRPGESVKTAVHLQNVGQTAACHAILKVVDLGQSEDGQWMPVDPNMVDSGNRPDLLSKASCRNWVTLSRGETDVLEVGPGRTESVDVEVRVPRQARGFSCAAIVVHLNPSPEATGVVMEYEYIVPVLVGVEGRPSAQGVRLLDARLEPADGGQPESSLVCLVVENEGTTFSRLLGSARISLVQGSRRHVIVPKVDFGEVGIIPGSRLVLKAPLPQSLPRGLYRVAGAITIDQRSAKRIETDVEFTGNADMDGAGRRTPVSAHSSMIQAGSRPASLDLSIPSTEPVAAMVDDGKTLKVLQATTAPDPFHTYAGSKTAEVHTNLPAHLIVSAVAASPAGGDWTAKVTQAPRSDGTRITISVRGEHVQVERLAGTSANLQVARVTVQVAPWL